MPDRPASNLLTHSRLRTLRSCARKHEYSYELGIRPATPAKALRMGTAVHTAIEHRGKGESVDDAIRAGAADYDAMPPWADDPVSRTSWLLEGETVRRMLVGYFWRWGGSSLETIASELEVEFPIVNPATGRSAQGYSCAIKIDGIVRLEDGRLAVRETKTARESIEPGADYWRKLRMDGQISLAVMAARRAGHDVQAVLYDALRKPSIQPKQLAKRDQQNVVLTGTYFGEPANPDSTGESVSMWGARLRADMGERPEFYFQRIEIARLDSDLREFERDLWDLYQALRGYRKRGHWPRNADSCLSYGRCPYFGVCSEGRHLTADDELPAGMVQLANVHPELSLSNGDL